MANTSVADVQLLFDALLSDDITYDISARRYRYKDSGKFVSKNRTIEIQKEYLAANTKKFTYLGKSIKDGTITEKELALELKKLHTSQLVIARGGVAEITHSDLGSVANLLRNQYYRGKDPKTGKRYGLRYLLRDAPNQSEAKLNQRLTMFAKASEITKFIVNEHIAKEQGLTVYRRRLGRTHKHCSSCLLYESLGWQLVSSQTLPYPKTSCECLSNCVCELVYDRPENVPVPVF